MNLIEQAELPLQGVVDSFGNYLVVREDERLVGVCGLEVHDTEALLRSVAVDKDFQGQGIGVALVDAALELARKMSLKAVYLLTTTAQGFFERCGFVSLPRSEAPVGIRESWEFKTGCVHSAVFMKRDV